MFVFVDYLVHNFPILIKCTEHTMNKANAVNISEEEEEEEETDSVLSVDNIYYVGGEEVEEDYDYEIEEEFKAELTEKFAKLHDELENCVEDEQKLKIKETNEPMDEIDKEESFCDFGKRICNKINNLIEEEKLSMENTILLLKRIVCRKVFNDTWSYSVFDLSLDERIQKMIVKEEKKKDEKNEKHLIDLCMCYLMLPEFDCFITEVPEIFVSCLLKIALKAEESEEIQKEVEMAFIALSSLEFYQKVKQELYLNKIKEIIHYHQEHRNLTRLAYQLAWKFLVSRFRYDKSLKGVIVDELHFVREATRELEDLIKHVNWKRKKDEMSRSEKKETKMTKRWICIFMCLFCSSKYWSKEFIGLIGSTVQIFLAAKENFRKIRTMCISSLRKAAENRAVKADDLLNEGATEVVFEELHHPTLIDESTCYCLKFFHALSKRLKGNADDEIEEAKRKAVKRELFEIAEDEGYEDITTSFQVIFPKFFSRYHYYKLPNEIFDCFVFV
ncbi:uncharacterized protein MONOS_7048 [Monocercomonoides exilis]|uniref:uncharacterized protein n=1 Tax=Monocercomonoides exilis TaxID=2049356 RepID=UPI0035597AF1|nr:hypothetical protein MONOS_7048 [Monocercomonoides exilis]|eukprot:MONOS_7048.1-p1 / transcript=MONOS_7048.1 / gene=MONOS_7048 / organism=Monocercomonoides_exilis_PA203 / gene_product=unspecified product / transcript_product=unspecified product / location=Mono_scaffold00232:63365-65003(+) / protein_length=502 / sequence_SO=supercontig / SO=protein_coding / is_pseudo=false